LFALFHGGNTGSNPVGDAKPFQSFARTSSELCGTTTVQLPCGLIMLTTLLCRDDEMVIACVDDGCVLANLRSNEQTRIMLEEMPQQQIVNVQAEVCDWQHLLRLAASHSLTLRYPPPGLLFNACGLNQSQPEAYNFFDGLSKWGLPCLTTNSTAKIATGRLKSSLRLQNTKRTKSNA